MKYFTLILKIQYTKKIKEPRTILHQTTVMKNVYKTPKVRNARIVKATVVMRDPYLSKLGRSSSQNL